MDVWMRRVVVAVVGGCARIVSLCLICVATRWLVVMLLRVRERGSLVPLHLCLVSVVHHVTCALLCDEVVINGQVSVHCAGACLWVAACIVNFM